MDRTESSMTFGVAVRANHPLHDSSKSETFRRIWYPRGWPFRGQTRKRSRGRSPSKMSGGQEDILKGGRYDKIPGEGERIFGWLVTCGCGLLSPVARPRAPMQAGLGCRSRATWRRSLR